jgi:hypothetical protein
MPTPCESDRGRHSLRRLPLTHPHGLETGAADASVSGNDITRANFQEPSRCRRITRITFPRPVCTLPFDFAVDARSATQAGFRPHASNEVPDVGLDAWPAWPPARASAPPSRQPAAMPTGDGRRLDPHQRRPPPRPHPSQAHSEPAVRGAEASTGTRADAELVAKSEDLEEEVPPRAQGGAKHRNHPQRMSHGPQNGRQQRPRQRFSARTR